MINEGCALSHADSALAELLGFEGKRRCKHLMTPDCSTERFIFDISHQPAIQWAVTRRRPLYAGGAADQCANFRVGEQFCRRSFDKRISRPGDTFGVGWSGRPDVMMLERYGAIGLGPEGKRRVGEMAVQVDKPGKDESIGRINDESIIELSRVR